MAVVECSGTKASCVVSFGIFVSHDFLTISHFHPTDKKLYVSQFVSVSPNAGSSMHYHMSKFHPSQIYFNATVVHEKRSLHEHKLSTILDMIQCVRCRQLPLQARLFSITTDFFRFLTRKATTPSITAKKIPFCSRPSPP